MADEQRKPRSAVDFYARSGASAGDPSGAPSAQGGRTSFQEWYGGRNLQGTESGWGADFFQRATQQRDEQIERSAAADGDPGKYYDWFQRDDATGVATWNDPDRKVRAEGGKQRGLRAGDVFDNGEFVHNLYDVYDEKEADVMLGEFVFDGDQKARLFARDGEKPGALSRELDIKVEENSRQAKFGTQAYETRERVAERADELDESGGLLDEFATFAAGAGGGAAAGAVFMNPFTIIGGAVVGGFAALANQDQFTESVARAQIQAERAKEQGINRGWAASLGLGEVLRHAASPISNLVAGTYEMVDGDYSDGMSAFNAVDPATGERLAGGMWQVAHLAAALPDSFLQFGSPVSIGLYQAGLAATITGKAAGNLQGAVWSDAEGGWHRFEDNGERSAAWASVGIDALQMAVGQWTVRAAQMSKQALGATEAASRTPAGAILGRSRELGDDWVAGKVDEVWGRLPGFRFGERRFNRVKRDQREAYNATRGEKVRPAETLSGSRFMFDELGNPIAARTTAVAAVPSEALRWLPAQMMARYKAIKAGKRPNEVTVEDLYEASLRMAGNGGRWQDAVLLGTAEGFEEMAQNFLDTQSYSGRLSGEEMLRAGAYGFMSGVGMGVGPMLSRSSADQNAMENARYLEGLRNGVKPSEREWRETWAAMSAVDRRRASTGTKEQMEEVALIRRAVAELHKAEVNANGIVPAMIVQDNVEEAADADAGSANRLSEGAAQAHFLPNELFVGEQEYADSRARRAELEADPGGYLRRRDDPDQRPPRGRAGLFRRSRFRANALALTSRRLHSDFAMKLRALRAHLESLPPEAPNREELEDEIAVLQHIVGVIRRARDASLSVLPDEALAKARRELEAARAHLATMPEGTEDERKRKEAYERDAIPAYERALNEAVSQRVAILRRLNRSLEQWAVEGVLETSDDGNRVPVRVEVKDREGNVLRRIDPSKDVVRRAGRIIYSRHPYIEKGSYFVSVPQVYPGYEFNEGMDGVVGLPGGPAQAAQLDYDGDAPGELQQAIFTPEGERFLASGSQFLNQVDKYDKDSGRMVRWEVNIARTKDEQELLNVLDEVFGPGPGLDLSVLPRAIAVQEVFDQLREAIVERYGHLVPRPLPGQGRTPLSILWDAFMRDVEAQNVDAVLNFLNGFVNLDGGSVGAALRAMGEETGMSELLELNQLFTSGLENAVITLKTMDPARSGPVPPKNVVPIREVNRAYISQRDVAYAATGAQTLALIGGPEGNRATAKLAYEPTLKFAVDYAFNEVDEFETEQFQRLAEEFFRIEGPGSLPEQERVASKNSTVQRTRGWLSRMGEAFNAQVEATTRSLDLMPERGLEFLLAGIRAPEVELAADGSVSKALPVNLPKDSKGRRSDVSLAQLALRESVRLDRAASETVREDDAIHTNLSRLDSMSRRRGPRSISGFNTLRELYGDIPADEILGDDLGRQLGNLTMNQWLAVLALMDKDRADYHFQMLMGRPAYRTGHRSDAPWSLGEIKANNLNAYTLFIDTMYAVHNKERAERPKHGAAAGAKIREAYQIVREFAVGMMRTDPERIRAFFGLPEDTTITVEHAMEFALFQQELAREVKVLFPDKAKKGTFRIIDGKVTSAAWVRKAFLAENPADAELMLVVESAIDTLNAEGAIINRDRRDRLDGRVRAVEDARAIESRLAILINRLAQMPSSTELSRFFKMYNDLLKDKSGDDKVAKLFEMINREAAWLDGEAALVPHLDSVKDFQVDPRDLWNSGTSETQRLSDLNEVGTRLRGKSRAMLKQAEVELATTRNVLKLEAYHKAVTAGQVPRDKTVQKLYENLETVRVLAHETGVVHGHKLRTSTMLAAGELIDMSDKGQSSKIVESIGSAYVLATSSNLKAPFDAEAEAFSAYEASAVMNNPQLLLRGPITIQSGLNGKTLEIDLSTMEGLIEALKVPGLRNLVYAALDHTEYDINTAGELQLYALHGPGSSLDEIVEDTVNQRVMNFDQGLNLEQAKYVISIFEERMMKIAEQSGSKDVVQANFIPVQMLLNNLTVTRSTHDRWHTYTTAQRERIAEQDVIAVAEMLVRLSQVEGPENYDKLVRLIEAEFVARWKESEGLPRTLDDLLLEMTGLGQQDGFERQQLIDIAVMQNARALAGIRADQQRLRNMEASLEEAQGRGDLEAARRIQNAITNSGLSRAEMKERADELARRGVQIVNGVLEEVDMDAGMITYRAARNSYRVVNADKSEQARVIRQRLVVAVKDMQHRASGKVPPMVQDFLHKYGKNPQGLLNGDIPNVTDEVWEKLGIMAAKQAVADKSDTTGSSVMFSTSPDEKAENGFHYWDESFSYLARPLLTSAMREAAEWFGKIHLVPGMAVGEAARKILDSGPFKQSNFGRWNGLIVTNMINLQKAVEGASVTLAVPIGGSLPKTQFDAAVLSYSNFEAEVKDEHHTKISVALRPPSYASEEERPPAADLDFNRWTWEGLDDGGNEWRKDVTFRLNMHFARSWSFTEILSDIRQVLSDEDAYKNFLMRAYGHSEEQALELIEDLNTRRRSQTDADAASQWVEIELAEWERKLNSAFIEYPGEPGAEGYRFFDAYVFARVMKDVAMLVGDQTFEFDVEIVDIEKKPFTPQYRNHGLFDGVGRRSVLEQNISPIGAMVFGVGAFSKQTQQQVFDYTSRGGTSYKPYYPTPMSRYVKLTEDAVAAEVAQAEANDRPPRRATARMRAIAAEWMSKEFVGHDDMIPSDQTAAYKFVVGRFLYFGKDPSGTVRHMWAEDVVSMENDPANAGWDTSELEVIPLSEEVFHILHGANAQPAGQRAVQRPAWRLEDIDMNPSLDMERLIRLGLEGLGQKSDGSDMEFAQMGPLAKRTGWVSSDDTSLRTSLQAKAEQLLRLKNIVHSARANSDEHKQHRKKYRDNQSLKIGTELEWGTLKYFQDQISMSLNSHNAVAIRQAQDIVVNLADSMTSSSRTFYFGSEANVDPVMGIMNIASLQGIEQALNAGSPRAGDPTMDDIVAINLNSSLVRHGKDTDKAIAEVKEILNVLGKTGATIVLVAPGNPTMLEQTLEFLDKGTIGYVRHEGNRFVWEPLTENNMEGATSRALRSSLTAVNVLPTANVHVTAHLKSHGINLPDNAGSVWRPEMLNMPVQVRYALVPTSIQTAHFGSTPGQFAFTMSERNSPRYVRTLDKMRDLLRDPETRNEWRLSAAETFLTEQGEDEDPDYEGPRVWGTQTRKRPTRYKDALGRWREVDTGETETIVDPDPKNVELYRRFEETDSELLGVRSFEDAYEIFQDKIRRNELPMIDGDHGLRAGDFYVLSDGADNYLIMRLGFEPPGLQELLQMFNSRDVAIVPPKIDRSTVIPPDLEIVRRMPDSRGSDFEIKVPISAWSKTIMAGNSTKYTNSPLRADFRPPEQVLGQNGRDITFVNSSGEQQGKSGFMNRADVIKGIWAIAGMDDVRVPIVNTLLGKDYRTVADKGFTADWDIIHDILTRWSSYDFGMTDAEIADRLNMGRLFNQHNIDLTMSLDPLLKDLAPNIQNMVTIPDFTREMPIERKITFIYLAALASRSIKMEHITSTPGIWSVKNPVSSPAGIIMMPDIFTDPIGRDDELMAYFVQKANARIERFPAGHPKAGEPVGRWDEYGAFHFWAQRAEGDWIELDAWLSLDNPTVATQNPSTYANIDMLAQKGGFTRHVASVLLLSANAEMIHEKKKLRSDGTPPPSRLDQIFDSQQIEFSEDPMAALNAVFDRWSTSDPDGSGAPIAILEQQQNFERLRRAAALREFRDFEFLVDRTGEKWRTVNPEIEDQLIILAAKTGIGSAELGKYVDHAIRMFYGYPGPKEGQPDWQDKVNSEDYLEGLKYFISQMSKNLDPLTGGAMGMMHPDFALALHAAGKWAPATRQGTNRTELASSWEQWVQAIFGQWVNSNIPIEEWWSEEWDGLLQAWKTRSELLTGLGLSLDMIRNLLPKNRQVNEALHSLDALTDRSITDPLILDAWDTVDRVFTGRRTPEDLDALRNAKYTQAEYANRQRRQWAAKQQMPKPIKRMRPKDFLKEGALYIDKRTEVNKFYAFATNMMYVNRLFDPSIYVSGFIEQPIRMMFEHITGLLTGTYTGFGAKSVAKVIGSERVQKVANSKVMQDLGFGDFQQSYTYEDLVLIDRMAKMLAGDVRWLSILHQDTQYVNMVQKAEGGKLLAMSDKAASSVVRTFSDPSYGSSQPALAKRYLMGAIEHLHGQGQRISLAGLAVELRKDPLFLEKQYGDLGLTPHKAGMQRVLQVRSQKLVPFSRAISSGINSMIASPRNTIKLMGYAANVPFAFVRFTANGLSFISGMEGWSQAAAMFFAGRRRPKILGGGVKGREEFWDLDDVLETIDLRHTFIRSGATLTMLFALGMVAGGTFGFAGENEEERRRRKMAMYNQLVDVKDPMEPENNFLMADAIFFDSVPWLSALFDDGQGANAIVPHWVLRQFTSPILGMSRFFQTGDFREIGYGFFDAFTAVPHSTMRLWHEADMTAKLLFDEAALAAEEGTETGIERMNQFLITAFGIYERALFENQFINGLVIGSDKYDRDPFKVPVVPGSVDGPALDALGNPLPTKALEAYYDPETGEVMNKYLTRTGSSALAHQYAENNVVFGGLMHLITGMDDGYLRKDMVVKQRTIDLGETPEDKAEAAIYALYYQNGGSGVEALTKDEIAYALKADARKNDIYWNEDEIDAQAQKLYESHDVSEGALSFMGPDGEVLTDWGGDRIIQGLANGTIKFGGPQMAGIAMDQEMRDRLSAKIQNNLVEDGLNLGLPQKTAEYRARRIWYGDDMNPEIPGLREILYSDQIPVSSKVKYNQLNVMYMMGPDGKPWATPFERKTLSQAFLPTPHNMVPGGAGLVRDPRGMMIDEVLGINTGLAGLERVPEMPEKLEPNDDAFKVESENDDSGYGRYSRPWRRYSRGGGGGGGGFTPQMRPLPGGTAARFDGLQFINTSNPIIRRANVNRQRIWSERGRLKQWQ